MRSRARHDRNTLKNYQWIQWLVWCERIIYPLNLGGRDLVRILLRGRGPGGPMRPGGFERTWRVRFELSQNLNTPALPACARRSEGIRAVHATPCAVASAPADRVVLVGRPGRPDQEHSGYCRTLSVSNRGTEQGHRYHHPSRAMNRMPNVAIS